MKKSADGQVRVDFENAESIAKGDGMVQFFRHRKVAQRGARMQGSYQRGEAAAESQAGITRFARQSECADPLIQIIDRTGFESTGVSFAAKDGIEEQPLRKRAFQILCKCRRAVRNASVEVAVVNQCLKPERVSERTDR